jgi:16S rRNA (cytosine967-C5)-methyltransferase
MTPAGRVAAAIELLGAIDAAPRKPADAIASAYFRDRRYIGSGDRRAVSARAWAVIRARRRCLWWLARLGLDPTPRMLVAASLLIEGWTLDGVDQTFSGGEFGPTHLSAAESLALSGMEQAKGGHPDMPEAVRLELPDWIVPHLRSRFGATLEDELSGMDGEAPLDMRVNLLKSDRDTAQVELAREGIEATPTTLSPWGLRVPSRRPIGAGKAFQSGLIEIQDEGSQLIALIVDAKPGMRVADWCAGAGGKTLAIAMTMQNRGHIVACDVHDKRLAGAVARLRRAGVHNVEQHLIEPGSKWAKRRAGSFDRVLVDAPCTGTGTWRRNPDGRSRLAERDLDELVPKQAQILRDAAKLVRAGGHLIYATCSLLPAENEAQVDAFLANNPDFTLVPLPQAWPLASPPPCAGDYLSLTPKSHDTDGFFAAVLERKGAPA